MEAISIVKNHSGITLPADEAGFIAMHILNAEMELDMDRTRMMTKIIQDVLNIVKYHLTFQLNQDSWTMNGSSPI